MVDSECYLSHVSSQDGKAESIASSLCEAIRSTELEKNLQVIGSDAVALQEISRGGHNFHIFIKRFFFRPNKFEAD